MHGIKEKLTWFLNNIDKQIDDIELEERGVAIDVYFDTVDVRDAVLGLFAFLADEGGFQIEDFSHERILVDCLATSGWLGRIRMLPPHQAEFLVGLNLDFGVRGFDSNSKTLAEQFLRAVSVTPAAEWHSETLTSLRDDALTDFVRQHVGSAVSLFKAVQCIRGGTWQNRLARFMRKGMLTLEMEKFDHNEIVKSPAFRTLRRSFDERRPHKPLSNFADAFAVTCLLLLVEQFNRGASNRIPRFFVSSPLFRSAVRDARVDGQLVYRINERQRSIMMDADYFVFKAIFRPSPKTSLRQSPLSDEAFELRKLRAQLTEILDAQQSLVEESIDTIVFFGVPIRSVIEDFHAFSFFENVWLPSSARVEMRDTLRDLGLLDDKLNSEGFRKAVEEALKRTKDALVVNVREYQRISSLSMNVDQAVANLQKHFHGYFGKSLDFFRDFGLLRFAFPESSRPHINSILEALFSGDEQAEKYARTAVVAACHERFQDKMQSVEGLAVTAAILWVMRLDNWLIELLGGLVELPHFSLKLVYVAAIFRQRGNVAIGRKVLNELIEQHSGSTHSIRADLAVGIAYLLFHLSSLMGLTASWRLRGTAGEDRQSFQSSVDQAIAYAREAYESMEDIDLKKKAYALNQYLYYMVEGGTDDLGLDMQHAAIELTHYKVIDKIWQYRFDDTLARYFHRLATSATTHESWTERMQSAKNHIQSAVEASYGDEEVSSYRTLLDLESAGYLRTR